MVPSIPPAQMPCQVDADYHQQLNTVQAVQHTLPASMHAFAGLPAHTCCYLSCAGRPQGVIHTYTHKLYATHNRKNTNTRNHGNIDTTSANRSGTKPTCVAPLCACCRLSQQQLPNAVATSRKHCHRADRNIYAVVTATGQCLAHSQSLAGPSVARCCRLEQAPPFQTGCHQRKNTPQPHMCRQHTATQNKPTSSSWCATRPHRLQHVIGCVLQARCCA